MIKSDSLVKTQRISKSTVKDVSVKSSDRLFFNIESDDSQSENSIDMHSSMSKLQRLKSLKNDCSKIGPSLMKPQLKQDNYILANDNISTHQIKKTRVGCRQNKSLKKFEIIDNDDEQDIKKDHIKMQHEAEVYKCVDQFDQVNCLSIQTNIDMNIVKTKKKFFDHQVGQKMEVNQAEENKENEQNKQNHNEITETIQQGRNKLIFEINSDESSDQQQAQLQIQRGSETTTCGQQKQLQLITPQPHISKLSSQLSTKLATFQDPNNMRIFLQTPIPQGIYFEFQVHKFKNFMKTQYLFWLVYNDSMSLFAKATSDKLYLDKNVFTIMISTTKRYSHMAYKQFYIGELVSDFKRDTYTLYDHSNYTKPKSGDKVICTVSTVPNFVNPKLKCHQLYIPKIINNKSSTIHNTSLTKNLKKLHKIQQFINNVSKFTTHTISNKIIQKMKQSIKIVTNTTRNATIKDAKNNIRFFILKMQQNRFRVRVGPGLTPIHVFSYAIVHLE